MFFLDINNILKLNIEKVSFIKKHIFKALTVHYQHMKNLPIPCCQEVFSL